MAKLSETTAFNAFDPSNMIVDNEKDVAALVAAVHNMGEQYNALAHKAVVNCIHWIAKTGRGTLLDQLYNKLPRVLQQATKEFVRRYCGQTAPTADGREQIEFWLTHTNKLGFHINNVKDAAGKVTYKRAADVRQSWVDAPEQFFAFPFMGTAIERVNPTFDDAFILASLERIIKRASKDDAHVSESVKLAMGEARRVIEAKVAVEKAEALKAA